VVSSEAPPSDIIWALRDVSFEVKRGEAVGVIGRNGAGKSTLLKILSRITEPTTGRATVYGRVGSLLEVGTGFHPDLTGRENVYLNGTILGMKKREVDAKFDEIVEFSGVEKFIDTPVKRYSNGMRVRLAFAVAAHLEPEILIVDEVLAVGDAEFQRKCLGKMQDVAGHGRTVLFVSHNLGAVSRLCPSGLYLVGGELQFAGAIEDVLANYTGSLEAGRVSFNHRDITLEVQFLATAGASLKVWNNSEEMICLVDLSSERTLEKPAIDLAFYDERGTRVFALVSDGVGRPNVLQFERNLTFAFHVVNPGFACEFLRVDVGLRLGGARHYECWWQDVATLPLRLRGLKEGVVGGTVLHVPSKVYIKQGSP
jgi:lipopolysaccharide transport system ATP-binding protein